MPTVNILVELTYRRIAGRFRVTALISVMFLDICEFLLRIAGWAHDTAVISRNR